MKLDRHVLYMSLIGGSGSALGCSVDPDALDGSESGDGESGDGESGDGESGDGESGESGAEPFTCENLLPIYQPDGQLSGFMTCDRCIHRPEVLAASEPQGDDTCATNLGSCQTSADCMADSYGRCLAVEVDTCECDYGCATDADCEAGSACAPNGLLGGRATCFPAECSTDDDCGDGLCVLSVDENDAWHLACADPVEVCAFDNAP
jgi:hypothetical protein